MRVVAVARVETRQVLVGHAVHFEGMGPFGEVVGIRQLTVHEQVADFDKRRMLGELLDRITAMKQHPLLAVEVGNGAAATRRCTKTDIQREHAEFLVQGLEIDNRRPVLALVHRAFHALACRIIRYGNGTLSAHLDSPNRCAPRRRFTEC